MPISIKPEAIQLIGGVLAFAPQALVVNEVLKDVIPAEIVPLGYLLLTIGLGWEIILMLGNR